jgi:NDP-sugar pyrophosphorylase family protein
MKRRISITIDKDLLKKIDQRANGSKNRSHAIELVLSQMLDGTPRKAVVLCGGAGTRLRPITYEIPKALMPVHGRTLTEHLFDLFKKYNVHDITMAVGHLKEKIRNHYGDGSRFGINLSYIEENKPLGTAGPLRMARDKLTETFIMTNGDELKDIDIPAMYALHRSSGALATIALTTVSDPSAYGVARLDGNRILEFVEKPKKEAAPSNLINSGFYILEPEVLDYIPKGFTMIEKDVFPKLAKEGKLYGYPFSGQWFDTGTLERYEKALKEWKGIK